MVDSLLLMLTYFSNREFIGSLTILSQYLELQVVSCNYDSFLRIATIFIEISSVQAFLQLRLYPRIVTFFCSCKFIGSLSFSEQFFWYCEITSHILRLFISQFFISELLNISCNCEFTGLSNLKSHLKLFSLRIEITISQKCSISCT